MCKEWEDKREFTFELNGHYTRSQHVDLPVAQYHNLERLQRLDHHIRMSVTTRSWRYEREDDLAGDDELRLLPRKPREWTSPVEGNADLERVHGSLLERCCHCGEGVEFIVNLKTRHAVAQSTCQSPGGLPEYSVSFDIPSGKIVFANDLRHHFPVNASYDINYETGCKRTSEAYAAHGMFHFFVGNTCPSIYQLGNRLNIGDHADRNPDVNWDFDSMAELGKNPEFGARRGSICTDLWWYSAADYDDLKRRMGDKDFNKLIKNPYTTVVEVEPGHYLAVGRNHCVRAEEERAELTRSEIFRLERALDQNERKKAAKEKKDKDHVAPSYLGISDLCMMPPAGLRELLSAAKATLAAEKLKLPKFELRSYIERVGKCTGVNKHAVAEEKNQTAPSFEDYIKICRLAYPDLYPTRARILEHTFLVTGNGLEWLNGTLWTPSEAMEEARDRLAAQSEAGVEIKFENQPPPKSYYPISQYARALNVPSDVKPDWLAGAFEALELVSKTDPNYHDGYHPNITNIEAAKKAIDKLYELKDDGANWKRGKTYADGSYDLIPPDGYRIDLEPVWTWRQNRCSYAETLQAFLDGGWTPENGYGKRGTVRAYEH